MKRLSRFHNLVFWLLTALLFLLLYILGLFHPLLMTLTGGKRSNLCRELGEEFLTVITLQFLHVFLCHTANLYHFRKLTWILDIGPLGHEPLLNMNTNCKKSRWIFFYVMHQKFRKSSFYFYLQELWLARNYAFRTCKQSIYLPASEWDSEFQWKHLFVC